ncbi:hypothetical protein [Cupriavidus necator]
MPDLQSDLISSLNAMSADARNRVRPGNKTEAGVDSAHDQKNNYEIGDIYRNYLLNIVRQDENVAHPMSTLFDAGRSLQYGCANCDSYAALSAYLVHSVLIPQFKNTYPGVDISYYRAQDQTANHTFTVLSVAQAGAAGNPTQYVVDMWAPAGYDGVHAGLLSQYNFAIDKKGVLNEFNAIPDMSRAVFSNATTAMNHLQDWSNRTEAQLAKQFPAVNWIRQQSVNYNSFHQYANNQGFQGTHGGNIANNRQDMPDLGSLQVAMNSVNPTNPSPGATPTPTSPGTPSSNPPGLTSTPINSGASSLPSPGVGGPGLNRQPSFMDTDQHATVSATLRR